jgi:sec-independent protein translocase protein TatA
MLSQIGLTEILLILGGVILLFGAKRIPTVGRALGQGISNFISEIRGTEQSRSPELPDRPESPPEVKPGQGGG